MEKYEELLKRAMEKIPKKTNEEKRFKIPEISIEIHGNKTFIKNFGEIVNILRRNANHLAKYFFKELATPGNIQGSVLILQTRISRENLEKKTESYIKEFVFCKICGEPDTKLVKEDRINFIICEACGAKYPVRQV